MKKLLLSLLFLCCGSVAAHGAAPEAPEGLPPGTPAGNPAPDYISNRVVPLNPKEQQALQLSDQWSKTDIPPVRAGGGKIVYVHGAVMPTVIASPMQICDVELQPGERVNEIVVGDSARWMVESGSAGQGPGQTVHLFIKPVDAGLESTAVITTDRRVYHLRLISRKEGHTPYVGFTYADDLSRSLAAKKAQEQRREQWSTTESADGERTDLSKLNFNYKVSGDKVSWRPERIYDDGRQTFIRLSDDAKTGEMPVLLVRKSGNDVLVNYRVQDTTVIVDGLFDRMNLVVGVGGDQEKVEIRRQR